MSASNVYRRDIYVRNLNELQSQYEILIWLKPTYSGQTSIGEIGEQNASTSPKPSP